MGEQENTKDWFQLIANKGLYVIVGIFVIYFILLLFLTWPISKFSISNSGVLGDSFGILTALFSGLAFWGVCVSINFQRKEMKGAIQLFENQKKLHQRELFETTFFSMIKLLNSNVQSVTQVEKFKDEKVEHKGREAFFHLIRRFSSQYSKDAVRSRINTGLPNEMIKMIRETCDRTYATRDQNFAFYPRNIRAILEYIDTCTDKKRIPLYVNILSSSISDSELMYVFYTCFAVDGKNLCKLVIKLNFLRDLPEEFIVSEHKQLKTLLSQTQ